MFNFLRKNNKNNSHEEKVLEKFQEAAKDVSIETQFLQNEEGAVVASYLIVRCGDKYIASDPTEFDWPLAPLPMPEAFKDALGEPN